MIWCNSTWYWLTVLLSLARSAPNIIHLPHADIFENMEDIEVKHVIDSDNTFLDDFEVLGGFGYSQSLQDFDMPVIYREVEKTEEDNEERDTVDVEIVEKVTAFETKSQDTSQESLVEDVNYLDNEIRINEIINSNEINSDDNSMGESDTLIQLEDIDNEIDSSNQLKEIEQVDEQDYKIVLENSRLTPEDEDGQEEIYIEGTNVIEIEHENSEESKDKNDKEIVNVLVSNKNEIEALENVSKEISADDDNIFPELNINEIHAVAKESTETVEEEGDTFPLSNVNEVKEVTENEANNSITRDETKPVTTIITTNVGDIEEITDIDITTQDNTDTGVDEITAVSSAGNDLKKGKEIESNLSDEEEEIIVTQTISGGELFKSEKALLIFLVAFIM